MARSVPGYRFRRDSAQINSHYWMGRMAEGAARYHLKKHSPEDDPMKVLGLGEEYARRLGHNIGSVKEQVDIHSRWKNLTILLMLTSALERYITDAASTAVNSDPALRPGFPKRVDGLLLEKYGLTVPHPNLVNLVKGQWPGRIAALTRLFGEINVTPETVSILEDLRKKRNTVAHGFGLDREGNGALSREMVILMEGRGSEPLDSVRVSNKRIEKYFSHVQRFVDAVDTALLERFIGDFEPAVIYIQWKRDPDAFENAMGVNLSGAKKSHDMRFPNVLSVIFDRSLGRAYCRSLAQYVGTL